MPPDPILALLAFVGLFAYLGVGAVFGVAYARWFDGKGALSKIADGTDIAVFGWIAALWPGAIALTIVGGSIFFAAYGPIWFCGKVGKYIANSQIGAPDAA
jgi:hypothetical protein